MYVLNFPLPTRNCETLTELLEAKLKRSVSLIMTATLNFLTLKLVSIELKAIHHYSAVLAT